MIFDTHAFEAFNMHRLMSSNNLTPTRPPSMLPPRSAFKPEAAAGGAKRNPNQISFYIPVIVSKEDPEMEHPHIILSLDVFLLRKHLQNDRLQWSGQQHQLSQKTRGRKMKRSHQLIQIMNLWWILMMMEMTIRRRREIPSLQAKEFLRIWEEVWKNQPGRRLLLPRRSQVRQPRRTGF